MAQQTPDPFLRLIRRKAGKVLVADDDPVMRHMIEVLLARGGFEYRSVQDGQEAVKAWEEEEFFLVLMDIQMPNMDGIEATQAIREKEKAGRPRVPVVAITAYAIPGDDVKCRAAGMDDYLTKPIDFDLFYSVLDRYARKRVSG